VILQWFSPTSASKYTTPGLQLSTDVAPALITSPIRSVAPAYPTAAFTVGIRVLRETVDLPMAVQLSALRLAGGLNKLPGRSIRCQPIYLSFQIWPLKCGHLKTKEIYPNIL
jgi:hypothetical protein